MLEVIIGLWVSIITQIAKNRWISAKWIVLVLAIVVAGIYVLFSKMFAEEIDLIWRNVLEVYWVSQIIYNYWIKFFEKNE